MSRATLTRPVRSTAGATVATANVTADGIAFTFQRDTVLLVYNGSVASIDVTLQRPGTADGDALDDKVVAVPAGEYKLFSSWDYGIYAQTDGKVYVDFSATTSVWAIVL